MKQEKEEEMKFLHQSQDTHYMITKQVKKLEKSKTKCIQFK
jgi:hypothetical protein